ncbi:MAG: choice-of-anchor J domain-containing protein [Muribaculaceae bacterium]|nr:choice-of-anchor J domain-containing protein [Muribaculaceae bacterium]
MTKALSHLLSLALAVVISLPAYAATPFARKVSAATNADKPAAAQKVRADKPKGTLFSNKLKSLQTGANAFRTSQAKANAANRFKAPRNASAAPANLLGSVIFSENEDLAVPGMYTVPQVSGSDFGFLGSDVNASYGGVIIGQEYYATSSFSFFGYTFPVQEVYSTETWEFLRESEGLSNSILAMDVTLDPVTGNVYGFYFNEDLSGAYFGIGNYAAGSSTPIKDLDRSFNCIAADGEGNLFAIDMTGVLYSVDKNTGNMTAIGNTGVVPYYTSSATIDPRTGRMFWSVCPADETGLLFEVDTTTAEATLLCQFSGSEQVCGLVVLAPLAEDAAPAAVSDLSVNFEGSSLTGTVDFTAPATLFDGTPASGDVAYTVTVNGDKVECATTTFGATVSVPVTVPASGTYTFAVYCSNEAGQGPQTSTSLFIGFDTPETPQVNAVLGDNNNVTVSWNEISTGVNGSALSGVTYDVTRMPGNVSVVANSTETSCTDVLPQTTDLTGYYYIVTAKCNGNVSEAAESNILVLGTVTPAYVEDFSAPSSEAFFTVIDANEDTRTFRYHADGEMRYTYNTSLDADDWLITPGLNLEAGKLYSLILDVAANGYPEAYEVKMGNAATAEAMTVSLAAKETLSDKAFTTVEIPFTPAETGVSYIGIHCVSPADSYLFKVSRIEVTAPRSVDIPADITDLTVTPDATGALNAVISFTAPAKTYGGNDMTGSMTAKVSRDGELISTATVMPGEKCTVTDSEPTMGVHVYTAVVTNAEGDSNTATAKAYIGVNVPGNVTFVSATEDPENYGNVTLTWDPVTVDVDGNPISSSLVTYAILDESYTIIASGLTDCTYTFQAQSPTATQRLCEWYVAAQTSNDYGEFCPSNLVFVGAPEEDYTDSFADGKVSYDYMISSEGEGAWSLFTDENFSDVKSQDGDNGFLGLKGQYINDGGSLETGKILVPQKSPVLTFYTLPLAANDINTIKVEALTADGDKTLVSLVENQLGLESYDVPTWVRVSVNMAEYAGKVVRLRFTVSVQSHGYILFDNIALTTGLDYDMAVKGISAPANVTPGQEYEVSVDIANLGGQKAENAAVNLYANGALFDSVNSLALEPGASMTVDFTACHNITADEATEYYAEIVLPEDENPDNNISKTVTVALKHNKFPTVQTLEAVSTENGVKLTWVAPDTESAATTESFEEAESWAHEVEGWTFIDGDESEIGGIQGLELPGIEAGKSKASYFVFDNTLEPIAGSSYYAAVTGNKFIAAMFRYDDGQTSDWAISPELSAKAQTVSFYAKSYSGQYPEKIQVLYSTTGTDIADFTPVMTVNSVPQDWTEYTADLPEGAKYFAIHSCAQGSFMLFVDDVTYAPANSTLELTGYNVYRNGNILNQSVHNNIEYLDTDAEDGDHTYHVSAVYDRGESAPVSVKVSHSGIFGVSSEAVRITTLNRAIVITGAEGKNISVYSTDGKLLFSAKGHANTVIPAQAGVYMVQAGDTVNKVNVK